MAPGGVEYSLSAGRPMGRAAHGLATWEVEHGRSRDRAVVAVCHDPEPRKLPRERVRAGGGDQPLRHPVVDVAEALEGPFLVLDDVEE